jgi:hypothetical protein
MKLISVEERGKSELKEMSDNKAIKRLSLLFSDRLKIMRVCYSANSSAPSKMGILFDQIRDSAIVAGKRLRHIRTQLIFFPEKVYFCLK